MVTVGLAVGIEEGTLPEGTTSSSAADKMKGNIVISKKVAVERVVIEVMQLEQTFPSLPIWILLPETPAPALLPVVMAFHCVPMPENSVLVELRGLWS
jgi:hypothetical protein